MNILMMGLNDPAGMMIAFANAINRYTEHRARVVTCRSMYQMDYQRDIEIPRLAEDEFGEVEALLQNADIFHFHMLMDEDYQLGPLAIRDYVGGKKILHHHHGTYDHQCFLGKAEEYEEKYQRLGRTVIASTPDLLKLLPSASWQPNIIPIHDSAFLPRFDHLKNQECVRIVQAPTRTWHKHTAEFRRVSKRLAEKYPYIQPEVLEGLSYAECLASKRNAQLVFDHMNGWFGISSLESLSHGVPTLAGLDDWNIEQIAQFTGADDVPWVVVRTEAELEASLEQLIRNPEARYEIGLSSRTFMEQCWNEERVLAPLIETYNSL